jgi:hypothetical protein
MDIAEGLGYLGLVLVVASSSMRTITPLRVLSIASNLTFISYSLAEGLLPLLILYSLLLPINSIRLFQMQRLVRRIEDAAHGDLALEGLLPFMTRRRFRRGAVLFRKHDRGREMFYVLRGEIHLPELGKTIRAGAVLGEISLFAPDKRRTATAVCATARRLLENCARLEALPGRWADGEGPHARAAA